MERMSVLNFIQRRKQEGERREAIMISIEIRKGTGKGMSDREERGIINDSLQHMKHYIRLHLATIGYIY